MPATTSQRKPRLPKGLHCSMTGFSSSRSGARRRSPSSLVSTRGQRLGRSSRLPRRSSERSTPRSTFPNAKRDLGYGIHQLQSLNDGLELATAALRDATAIDSLHPAIYEGCRKLYESNDFPEAVEKGFKIVRDQAPRSHNLRDWLGSLRQREALHRWCRSGARG